MNVVYDHVITNTGWGICNYCLITLCALCSMAEASASLMVSIATPLIHCDFNFNKNDRTTLNAVSSLGMAIGGLLLGTLADHNGRKPVLLATMVLIFCGSIGLSFAQTYVLISLCIFILGVGISGNSTVLRLYLCELLPPNRRGMSLAFLDLIWILGYILVMGMSWLIIPSIVAMIRNEFRPSSWRVLAGLGGSPCLIMACVASLLPSSPRHLLYHGRSEQALMVLHQIFAINNSQHADNFTAVSNISNLITPDNEYSSAGSLLKIIKHFFLKTLQRMTRICSPGLIKITLLLFLIRLLLFPGIIWMALWIAQLVEQTVNNKFVDETCIIDIGDVPMRILKSCHEINNFHFKFTLTFLASFILGEALLVLGIDIIGRKLSLVTSGVIGGISTISLAFASHHDIRIIVSICHLASYSIIHTVTTIILLENYPTSVRGTMAGLSSVLPHLISFCIKFLTQIACLKGLYITSGLLIGATIAAMPIPDLTNAPIQE